MINKINLVKIIIMLAFLVLFGIVVFISQLGSVHLFNLNNSPAIADGVKKESVISSADIQNKHQDKFLLVYDPEIKVSTDLKDNFEKTMAYMKKAYTTVSASQLPSNLQEYKNIIILTHKLESIKDFSIITNYVSEGGDVFFGIRPDTGPTYERIHGILGINESEADTLYSEASGIVMKSDLLLKSKGLTFEDEIALSNSVLNISLKEDSKVLAVTTNHIPFIWSTPYEKGNFMVFNGTMLEQEMNRGFIVGALSYLNNNFLYPIINSKVMYIDDFPAPFPEGINETIYREYKTDIKSFFHQVWWPDMLRAAKEYDVKYTAGIIESYNDDVDGPFNERMSEENLKIFGRDIIQMGGELAVHGYNHQSLTMDQKQVDGLGYTAWKDNRDMVDSLKELNQFVQDVFPGHTLKTYIPPSNVLSEDGKRAIQEAIPSISNFASLFIPDDMAVSYIQEYEYSGQYYEIPRLTSDYHYQAEVQWIIANGATLFGVFSHFIHPDDILDGERSEQKGWGEMSKNYNEMLKDVKDRYPWMKSQTAIESTESLRKYQDAQVVISEDEQKVEGVINDFQGELDFVFRSDKKITDYTGCKVRKIDDDHYLIRALSSAFTIELEDE